MVVGGKKRVNANDIETGRRVRVRRELAGLSQTDLASAVGVTFQQIQKYEKGANRVSASRIVMLAKALNCKPADFFGDGANGATTGGDSEMLEQITEPGTVKMMKAFNRMPNKLRTTISNMIIELARLTA
jgi:transcriptional regulator with XRE-family HTH domain